MDMFHWFVIAVSFISFIISVIALFRTFKEKRDIDLRIANRIAVIGMILSLVINIVILIGNYLSSTTLNSKEYQIADNMRSDLWDLECTLRSIKVNNGKDTVDFSNELEILNRIQKSQSYNVLLYSIDKEKDRRDFEDNILHLTAFITKQQSKDSIQNTADEIIKILSKEDNKKLMHSGFWNRILSVLKNDRLEESHSKQLEELQGLVLKQKTSSVVNDNSIESSEDYDTQ